MKNFAARLRVLMEEQRLTQETLAAKAETSQTSVMRWCKGQSLPHANALPKLALALGVRPAWLIDGVEPRSLPVAMTRGQRLPDPAEMRLRETSQPPVYTTTNSNLATAPIERLDDHELWELIEGYPQMIATASNDTVRHRLASDAEAAASELKRRSKKV